MTRHNHLKSRIRARMAKTGERYTTARSQILATPATTPLGGHHDETVALRRLLARLDVLAPDGQPLSEAMLLGLGGGLGGAYFMFQYKDAPPTLYIGTRVGHQAPYTADFAATVLDALGVQYEVRETGGAKTAARHLEGVDIALAWVDHASCPWSPLPEAYAGHLPHILLYTGQTDDEACVMDIDGRPRRLSAKAFGEARARYKKAKHRLLVPASNQPALSAEVLRAASLDGVRRCCASLRDGALVKGFGGNFGLDALEKWARLVDKRSRKGWRSAFDGPALLKAATETYRWIETAGTGGGAFRPMFADFLGEAAAFQTDARAWHDAADLYRALGAAWTTLACRALDPDVPLFAESRSLLHKEAQARRCGDDRARREAAEARLALAARTDSDFLTEAQRDAFYRDLADHLGELVALEREAVAALEGSLLVA